MSRLSQTTMQETCSVSQKMISFRWWVAQKKKRMIERLIENLPGGSCGRGPVTQRLAHEASCSQVDFQHRALLYFSDIWILMPRCIQEKSSACSQIDPLPRPTWGDRLQPRPSPWSHCCRAHLKRGGAFAGWWFFKFNGFHNTQSFPQVPVGLFNKVIIVGPKKIQIKLTDDFLRYQRPDSAFHYNLVHEEGTCTIQMEPVHDWVGLATIWEVRIFPSWLLVVDHFPKLTFEQWSFKQLTF